MADKFPYTCEEPVTLLYSSITQKSAPKLQGGQVAKERYSGTFGLGEKDFKALLPIMVQAITGECGSFSGNPNDYYLACMSGTMAASRVRAKAELDAQALIGKGETDAAFKVKEKAEKRASAYEKFAGILNAASQFEIELARLEAGKIVDIKEPHQIAAAGKDFFYSGAKVVPRIAVQGFRRKKLDDKDGCTAFLQNCLFVAKGPKLDLGGGGPNNQEVYSGFQGYSDYDPLAMAPGGDTADWSGTATAGAASQSPGAGSSVAGNPPPPPPKGPQRPTDPAHRYDDGDGTEQWFINGAWDGIGHPIPPAGSPPPPPATEMW